MKKIIILLLSLVLITAFSGCAKQNTEKADINIVMPDGAPALVFAKMMSENKKIDNLSISYEIVAGADPLNTKILNGEADIAIMPTNLAANVYNKGIKIKLLSVNVHGSLYIVGKTPNIGLDSLKGETVYNIGQGGTPDLTFKYILKQNNIEYLENDIIDAGKVTLKYLSSTSELIPLLKSGKAKYGIMGEPAVTSALNNINNDDNINNDIVVALNIQNEWDKVIAGYNSSYPQASLVAKSDIISRYPAFIESLLTEINSNTAWINNNENIEAAKTALAANGSTMTVLNSDVITRSNVKLIRATDAKQSIKDYLSILPTAAIGGKLPDDGFYYINS